MPTATVYRHRFNNVEDYLHHRPPYLMIQTIASIDDNVVECSTVIRGDEFYMAGHFPGAPIVPGAMMQEMTTQAAGILIAANFNPMSEFTTHDPYANHYALGVLIKVKSARFKGFARPGATMHIRVELIESINQTFDFVGRITIDGQTIMRNEFQLSNILSKTLQGIT
jgi:3-hydroxyacyl-[acyl-carrier-protein] dehydratase